jgi:hypothetical protein
MITFSYFWLMAAVWDCGVRNYLENQQKWSLSQQIDLRAVAHQLGRFGSQVF